MTLEVILYSYFPTTSKWVPVIMTWGGPQVVDGGEDLQIMPANILNMQKHTAGPPAWGLSEVLTTPHCKNLL
jgi:hypothetical protein